MNNIHTHTLTRYLNVLFLTLSPHMFAFLHFWKEKKSNASMDASFSFTRSPAFKIGNEKKKLAVTTEYCRNCEGWIQFNTFTAYVCRKKKNENDPKWKDLCWLKSVRDLYMWGKMVEWARPGQTNNIRSTSTTLEKWK